MADSPDDTVRNPSGIPLKAFYGDGDAVTPPRVPAGTFARIRLMSSSACRATSGLLSLIADFRAAKARGPNSSNSFDAPASRHSS